MSRKGENIFKRKDGRWEARYKRVDLDTGAEKLVSVYAKTYLEAKNKRNIAMQTNSTSAFNEKVPPTTLNAIVNEWLDFNRIQFKPATIQKYEGIIRNHIRDSIGKHVIKEINRARLSKYTRTLLLTGNTKTGGALSPKTVNSILALISSALSWHEDNAGKFKMPFLKETSTRPQIFIPAERARLEEYIRLKQDGFSLAIMISLYTGMRIGEVCALRWEDIYEDVIYVRKTMQRIKTSDGSWSVSLFEPKTRYSLRYIPVSSYLKSYLAGFDKRKGFVVVQRNGKHIEPRLLQKRFGIILMQLGIPQRGFHCLRHTFATQMIEMGCDAKTVSEILGHSSVQITFNKYVHPSLDMKKKAVDQISTVFNVV